MGIVAVVPITYELGKEKNFFFCWRNGVVAFPVDVMRSSNIYDTAYSGGRWFTYYKVVCGLRDDSIYMVGWSFLAAKRSMGMSLVDTEKLSKKPFSHLVTSKAVTR